MRSLEEEIAIILSGAPFPSPRSRDRAKAVLEHFRDRLLSEEAVEAFQRAYETHGQLGHAKTQRAPDEHARACLLAALDRIESHDR